MPIYRSLPLLLAVCLGLPAHSATFPHQDVNPQDCSEAAQAKRRADWSAALHKQDTASGSRLLKESVNCFYAATSTDQ
ncbi:MAG: hypothetical protein JO171_07320 [Paludibacterium sp.]|uniref:hypothetical protein n=1 Tax=Paludibacterium sp. TaxID=1917523 RepID=UPI0025D5B27A|nr:hypothetical protein [Paludibacterium sp.]MBV8046944.1 hypothetical protein [Paludibacterium sp.]MBV8646537.1 hypothetical protein [Paludibacterium sp.]